MAGTNRMECLIKVSTAVDKNYELHPIPSTSPINKQQEIYLVNTYNVTILDLMFFVHSLHLL